ncbi:MAG TPA: ferritin-like domain-containing protein [Pyrinomonadaceae bacterium]|nr:ferritin-like domain-containing protein [Pyrinomonadaceae bacterium]
MESTGRQADSSKLVAILQLAYSGELAAAYAYRGHWHSLSDPGDRARVKVIEEEELHHRTLVGEMLQSLDAEPDRRRELRASVVGRVLGFFCHLSGWLAPMYGAGRLESKNIVEYETAARYARDCGRTEFVDCLLMMAEVEWEHEAFFRSCVLRHWLGKRLTIWPMPPAKENIRLSFSHEAPVVDDKVHSFA